MTVSALSILRFQANGATGFDQQGFNELKKLSGTSKWIGTSGSVHATSLMSIADDRVDLCTAFVYRGIPYG